MGKTQQRGTAELRGGGDAVDYRIAAGGFYQHEIVAGDREAAGKAGKRRGRFAGTTGAQQQSAALGGAHRAGVEQLAALSGGPPMQDAAQRQAALPAAEIIARAHRIDGNAAAPVEQMYRTALLVPERAIVRAIETGNKTLAGCLTRTPGQRPQIEAARLHIGAIDDEAATLD